MQAKYTHGDNQEEKWSSINHDFLFGCGAFDALPLTNDKKGDAFYKDCMHKWLELYNYGTMSFYVPFSLYTSSGRSNYRVGLY